MHIYGIQKDGTMNLFAGQQWRFRIEKRHGKGHKEKGGKNGESSMETYTLPYVKQIASETFLYDSGNSDWGCMTTRRVGWGRSWEGGQEGKDLSLPMANSY